MLECSRTIWILATNAFGETIHSFCKKHQKILNDETKVLQARNLVTELSTTIQKECIGKFSVRVPIIRFCHSYLPIISVDSQLVSLNRLPSPAESQTSSPS